MKGCCWVKCEALEPIWQRTRMIRTHCYTFTSHVTTSCQRNETASRKYNPHSPGSSSRYTSLCCSATAPARPVHGQWVKALSPVLVPILLKQPATQSLLSDSDSWHDNAQVRSSVSTGILTNIFWDMPMMRCHIGIVGIALLMQRRPSYNRCNSDHRYAPGFANRVTYRDLYVRK